MKKIKLAGIIILALTVIMQSMIITSADDQLGSITIHKYDVTDDQREDLDLPGDGIELGGDTDIGNGILLGSLTALEDIGFSITRVVLKGSATPGSINLDDYEEDTSNDAYNDYEKTNAAGIIKWEGLKPGYYLIEEDPNTSSTSISAPFIVQIPMIHPVTGSFLYNVHVYPKNTITGPDIDKEIVGLNPGTGDNVITWKISVDIPSDIKDSKEFIVTDALDGRLSYVVDSAKVYYIDKTSNNQDIFNSGYDIAYDNATNTLVFEVTAAGFILLDDVYSDSIDEKLYIEFDTIIDIDDKGDLGELENTAVLDYTNSHDYKHKPKEPTTPPTINLMGIEIFKKNEENIPLNGANFKIYPSKDDAKNETNALKDPNSNSDWEVTSDLSGFANFLGLQPGTYWLKETRAPAGGYNIILDPIEVSVYEENDTDDDFIVEVTVINNKGFILPITGGTGTMLFTIGGFALIGVATVILSISIFVGGKKKKSDKPTKQGF